MYVYFRAISYCMTGSEEFHPFVRAEVTAYLKSHKNEEWCELLKPADQTMDEHIDDIAVPAKDASETERYARDVDFAAASKNFKVNVLVHSTEGWRVYAPELNGNWKNSNQNIALPSFPIKYHNGHFEVILNI